MPCPLRVILVAVSAILLALTTYYSTMETPAVSPDPKRVAASAAKDIESRRRRVSASVWPRRSQCPKTVVTYDVQIITADN